MKDVRGIHATAVKSAIFNEFGLQMKNNRSKKANISEWKKSKQVKECYLKLYDDNENVTENIAKLAFPTLSNQDKSFYNVYVYTAAVCDIVLNPDYPDMECSRKPLERRIQRFKVFFC